MLQIETNTSIITFDTDGILIVQSKKEAEIELEDAKNDFKKAAEMIGHIKVPVFADSRNVSYHSKEVRDYYASKQVAERITAMAIIVDSISSKLFGNFFINVSKPNFPTKLFTKEIEARKWLKTFVVTKL